MDYVCVHHLCMSLVVQLGFRFVTLNKVNIFILSVFLLKSVTQTGPRHGCQLLSSCLLLVPSQLQVLAKQSACPDTLGDFRP